VGDRRIHRRRRELEEQRRHREYQRRALTGAGPSVARALLATVPSEKTGVGDRYVTTFAGDAQL
jgi:hypothetical protein